MRKYGIGFCLVTRAHRRTCIKWLCPKSNSKKFVTLCTFESMTSRDLFIMIFIILWGKSDCQNKGSALTQSHYLFRAITVLMFNQIPYARYHKPLLIRSLSWIQAIHKDRIFWKKLLKNKETGFENGGKTYKLRLIMAHVR